MVRVRKKNYRFDWALMIPSKSLKVNSCFGDFCNKKSHLSKVAFLKTFGETTPFNSG